MSEAPSSPAMSASDTSSSSPPRSRAGSAAMDDAPENSADDTVGAEDLAPAELIPENKRRRRRSKDESAGTKRRRKNLRSLDDDPDEKTAGTDVMKPDWQWPTYDEFYDNSARSKRRRGIVPKDSFPFQVIYRNPQQELLWPDLAHVRLKSPHLMAILSRYLKVPDPWPELDAREVYTVLDKLKTHRLDSDGSPDPPLPMSSTEIVTPIDPPASDPSAKSMGDPPALETGEADPIDPPASESSDKSLSVGEEPPPPALETGEDEARLHLRHLVRFVEEEFGSAAARQRRMEEEKSVSFDMLWAFLPPGVTVVYNCSYSQEPLCAKVLESSYRRSASGRSFAATLAVWDYNGVRYRQCRLTRSVEQFCGERPFDTLAVRPIDMDRTSTAQALEEEFLAKGRMFSRLTIRSSHCFMSYNGPIMLVGRTLEVVRQKADGRVMVDRHNFGLMNPSFPMQSASCRRAAPGEFKLTETDAANLIFAPAVVYGFSFALKRWGAFSVSGFREVVFDADAFGTLLMERRLKELIHSLVKHFFATSALVGSSSSDMVPKPDVISNKGEGCIFLCYGHPGTGTMPASFPSCSD